jgi:hypothetical protein
MGLSNTTIQKLSNALTEEAVSYIFQDERYVNFMQEILPEFIEETLGKIDEDLKYDLAMCIMDRISFRSYC